MYGLIGNMTAHAGQRDRLVSLMLGCVDDMPGCLSYVVALDPADETKIWITEVWDRQESHAASLHVPAIKAVIAEAMPLIAGFGDQTVTSPAGGVGLPRR